jgi:hypothetical protein
VIRLTRATPAEVAAFHARQAEARAGLLAGGLRVWQPCAARMLGARGGVHALAVAVPDGRTIARCSVYWPPMRLWHGLLSVCPLGILKWNIRYVLEMKPSLLVLLCCDHTHSSRPQQRHASRDGARCGRAQERVAAIHRAAGATAVFEAMRACGRPGVGHHMSLDLTFCLAAFVGPLPADWLAYKLMVQRWFPGAWRRFRPLLVRSLADGVEAVPRRVAPV